MKKSAILIYSILLCFFALLMTGCGKSLFAPLTSDSAGRNPELALERAEYLYLSGSIEEADALYQELMTNHASDPEQQEVYFEAVRGHSKCVLELGAGDTTEMLKGFVNFALNIDTSTFETDPDQLSGFNENAADFKERVWSSFEILLLIPDTNRTEADYANMSISGLFAVCTDFAGLMGTYVSAGNSVMEQINTLNENIISFTTEWALAEATYGSAAAAPADVKTSLDDTATAITAINTEIQGSFDETIDVMSLVQDQGIQVKNETVNADNPLTSVLNGVFDVVLETIANTLPGMQGLETGTGDFNADIAEAMLFNP